jgi:putative ABC transport system permease protein
MAIPLSLSLIFRIFRRRWLTFATALCLLAFGIGFVIAVFALLRAKVYSPLDYRDASAIVRISTTAGGDLRQGLSAEDAARLAQFLSPLGKSSSCREDAVAVTSSSGTELALAVRATANFFQVFEAPAIEGRTTTPGEVSSGQPVVVLSDEAARLWFHRRDPIGGSISIEGSPYTVVGVMAPAFSPPCGNLEPMYPKLWLPVGDSTLARILFVRLEGGAKAADVNQVIKSRKGSDSFSNSVIAEQLMMAVGEPARPEIALLRAIALGISLLAYAGFTHAIGVLRSAQRRDQWIKTALGMSRRARLYESVTEACVWAVLGGGGALGVASLLLPLMSTIGPTVSIAPRIGLPEVAMAAIAAAIIVFGAHAFVDRFWSVALVGNNQPARSRGVSVLIASEFATATALAVLAVLFTRDLATVASLPWGFDVSRLFVADMILPDSLVKPADQAAFVSRLEESLRHEFPDLQFAYANTMPFSATVATASWEVLDSSGTVMRRCQGESRSVSKGYLEFLDIPLIEGSRDASDSQPSAWVTPAFVSRCGGASLVGKWVRRSAGQPFKVIGMVADMRTVSQSRDPRPAVIASMTSPMSPRLAIGLRGSSAEITRESVLRAVHVADPTVPLASFTDVERVASGREKLRRFHVAIASGAAVLSILLACAGVLAVSSQLIDRRRFEFGLRLALGADSWDIVRRASTGILGCGFVGTAIGLVLARLGVWTFRANTVFAQQLSRTSSSDIFSFLIAPAAVLAMAILTLVPTYWLLTHMSLSQVLRRGR